MDENTGFDTADESIDYTLPFMVIGLIALAIIIVVIMFHKKK
jgi:hypothetical protein